MEDQYKTKEQLIIDLGKLRQRMTELEKSEAERKCAEEALWESEELHRVTMENILDPIFITNDEGIFTFVCHNVPVILGYPMEEIWTMGNISRLLGQDLFNLHELRAQGEIYNIERPIVTKDGKERIFLITIKRVSIKGGSVLYSCRDITERKKMEEKLRVSNLFLKIANRETAIEPLLNEFVEEIQRFTQCAAIGIRILDKEGNIPYQTYKGFSKRFYESESPLSIKSDQCMCINVIKGVTDPKLPFYTEAGSFYMNGTTRFLATISEEEKGKTRNVCNQVGYESVALIPIGMGDQIFGLIHIADSQENRVPLDRVEILETIAMQLGEAIQRLKSEEALRKSEEKYRAITENIPVTLYSALPDEHSTNLFVTRRLEELTGYPAKSFLDNPKLWVNIIHPEDKDRVWQAIEKHRQQRNQLEIEYRIVMPDQSIKWVRDKATPALDAEGVITRIDGFMEDITEQKKAEEDRERLLKKVRAGQRHLQALSRRLAEVQELERRNLVRKLHDEVGQNMTALSINLNIINSQLPVESSEKISFRVNDSMKLIEETVGRIRDVMAELRPPVLDDYGLMATLNWYSKQFSERTGIATVTEGDDLVPRLPSATETAFYRIAQEALTNVAKHAKAKQVSITLKTIDGKVSLTIIDDGIGFDHEAQQSDWGFLNMKERAQAIGGELIIESAPGRGTKVIAEVPRN